MERWFDGKGEGERRERQTKVSVSNSLRDSGITQKYLLFEKMTIKRD
jgi:hypothetical protein